ncbi:hypothetical protein HBA_0540 [Sodalis endosymbiont of Henestaris halophilus]|nr:hypothetical protein HBA_0540 [Sodalis endosymbiont of Henestaris halophilus]
MFPPPGYAIGDDKENAHKLLKIKRVSLLYIGINNSLYHPRYRDDNYHISGNVNFHENLASLNRQCRIDVLMKIIIGNVARWYQFCKLIGGKCLILLATDISISSNCTFVVFIVLHVLKGGHVFLFI